MDVEMDRIQQETGESGPGDGTSRVDLISEAQFSVEEDSLLLIIKKADCAVGGAAPHR